MGKSLMLKKTLDVCKKSEVGGNPLQPPTSYRSPRFILSYLILFGIFFTSCSKSTPLVSFDRKEVFQSIKIHYKYNFKDEINTFNLKCIKDLILDGTVAMDFWYNEDEQNTLIKIVNEIDFFNLSDTLKTIRPDSLACLFDPDPGLQSLKIKYLNNNKTVKWFLYNTDSLELNRISKITNLLDSILENDPGYQMLPEPNGGYL